MVTLDALHARQATARCLVEDCGAQYAITAVKGNQPTIHDDLAAIDWSRARWGGETVDKAHGRLEVRRCAAVDLDAPRWNGLCDFHGRRQAARVERKRTVLKTGETTREVACCLTSLGADQAGPDEIGRLVRGHWEVENRLHHVRDFTYDEDRCRTVAGNLAALSHAAISIVRVIGRFRHIPPPTATAPPAPWTPRTPCGPPEARRGGKVPKLAAACATAPRNRCARRRCRRARAGAARPRARETSRAKPTPHHPANRASFVDPNRSPSQFPMKSQ